MSDISPEEEIRITYQSSNLEGVRLKTSEEIAEQEAIFFSPARLVRNLSKELRTLKETQNSNWSRNQKLVRAVAEILDEMSYIETEEEVEDYFKNTESLKWKKIIAKVIGELKQGRQNLLEGKPLPWN